MMARRARVFLWGDSNERDDQSGLETAVFERLHEVHRAVGFPPAGLVREVQLNDGYLDLGGGLIEMKGLLNGMMAVALVQNRRLKVQKKPDFRKRYPFRRPSHQ